MVSFASPWRGIRAALGVALGSATADDIVKTLAVVLAVVLAALLFRGLPRGTPPAGDHALPPLVKEKRKWAHAGTGAAAARPVTDAAAHTDPAARAALAFALAWLLAWPYLLPWYDALAWALLPLVAASSLDWLLLVRTAALAFGYLPARSAGIVIPAGLGWLRTVVREGVTPAVLAVVVIWLIVGLVRGRISASAPPAAAELTGAAGTDGSGRDGGAGEAGPATSPAGTRRWAGNGRMGG